MPKFTYPVVFIMNKEAGEYYSFVPDLGIVADGKTMEEAYNEIDEIFYGYFKIALKHDVEIPTPTSLDDITKKWKDYKVSLITANLPDEDTDKK